MVNCGVILAFYQPEYKWDGLCLPLLCLDSYVLTQFEIVKIKIHLLDLYKGN
jgi:hypothetical protein